MRAKEVEKDEKQFEERLNDIWGTVQICGYTFDQGTALKELDPTAFDCALSDEPIQWECDECGEVFDDEDDADECCKPEETEEDHERE